MLTFMNSKLPDKLAVLTNNITFFKKVNPMKYPVQIYILVMTWNLLFMCIIHVYSCVEFIIRYYLQVYPI